MQKYILYRSVNHHFDADINLGTEGGGRMNPSLRMRCTEINVAVKASHLEMNKQYS